MTNRTCGPSGLHWMGIILLLIVVGFFFLPLGPVLGQEDATEDSTVIPPLDSATVMQLAEQVVGESLKARDAARPASERYLDDALRLGIFLLLIAAAVRMLVAPIRELATGIMSVWRKKHERKEAEGQMSLLGRLSGTVNFSGRGPTLNRRRTDCAIKEDPIALINIAELYGDLAAGTDDKDALKVKIIQSVKNSYACIGHMQQEFETLRQQLDCLDFNSASSAARRIEQFAQAVSVSLRDISLETVPAGEAPEPGAPPDQPEPIPQPTVHDLVTRYSQAIASDQTDDKFFEQFTVKYINTNMPDLAEKGAAAKVPTELRFSESEASELFRLVPTTTGWVLVPAFRIPCFNIKRVKSAFECDSWPRQNHEQYFYIAKLIRPALVMDMGEGTWTLQERGKVEFRQPVERPQPETSHTGNSGADTSSDSRHSMGDASGGQGRSQTSE